MHAKEIYVIFIHLFDSGILLIIDLNRKKREKKENYPLQLVNLHRNRRYFVIKLHTWFCLSYFLKTNIQFYCIYQQFFQHCICFSIQPPDLFRQFKEKNKNLLRLKLKSTLKIEQISVVL
jgi:hypothetical protein